jgi:hypothetical protein
MALKFWKAIYDAQGKYTVKCNSSGMDVSGYNSKYIAFTDVSFAKIYNALGKFNGKYISLSSGI